MIWCKFPVGSSVQTTFMWMDSFSFVCGCLPTILVFIVSTCNHINAPVGGSTTRLECSKHNSQRHLSSLLSLFAAFL
jgi:hypothetical protein